MRARMIHRWVESGATVRVLQAGRVLDSEAGDSLDLIRDQLASGRAEPIRSEPETAVLPDGERRWRHKKPPDWYLRRYPTGPDADLARELTAG